MTRVVEINSLERLRGYRLHWNWLLSDTREATFFQTFDWLETYLRHFGDRLRLRILLVSGSDGPIGILPLVVCREAMRIGRARVLTYPMDGWGTFYGPIGPQPTATLLAGLRHIAMTPRDWDLVDLRWVDADGPDKGRSRQALRGAGLPAPQQPLMRAAQIEMSRSSFKTARRGGQSPFSPKTAQMGTVPGGFETAASDWDAYWSSREPDWRREVDRSRRRLAERGVEYVRYRPTGGFGDSDNDGGSDPRWDLYDACEEIARRSWQGSSTDGTTLSHSAVRSYLRDAHESAAAAGGVDLNLLRINGRPAAFAYNYHFAGQVYGLRAGFDPTVAPSGCGTVLLRLMVEDSFRLGDERIDLGPDSLDYKRHWATRIQTSYHYPHYAGAGVMAQALRAKRWLLGARR